MRQASNMQTLWQPVEKNTVIHTTQSNVELERSNMDFTDRLVGPQSLSRSVFSVKNVLAVEDFDGVISSIPKSVFPLLPCANFTLPMYAPPVIWARIDPGMESPQRRTIVTSFSIMNQLTGEFALYTNLQRRRILTKKKQRPMFSQKQVETMEKEFTKHRYITEDKRAELSAELDLTETQVKTWFQNRRTKWRKELRNKETKSMTETLSEKLSG